MGHHVDECRRVKATEVDNSVKDKNLNKATVKQTQQHHVQVRVRLVREFWRGRTGRGGEIFNLKCLVQFLEGEGREGEGSKSF